MRTRATQLLALLGLVVGCLAIASPAANAASEATVRMIHGTFAGTVDNKCVIPDGTTAYRCDISGSSTTCSETSNASSPVGNDCSFEFHAAYGTVTFTRDCTNKFTAVGSYYSGLTGVTFGLVMTVTQVAGSGAADGTFVDSGSKEVGTVKVTYETACAAGLSIGVLHGTFEYVSGS